LITFAVDVHSRQQVWSYNASGHLSISNEGALFIALSSGELVAINTSGDSDQDGMPDWWEAGYGFDLDSSADAAMDSDNDGLSNLEEYTNNTNPLIDDSDSDGLLDGDEVNQHLTDPNMSDTDGDTLNDFDEINSYSTNPLSGDSDGDGFSDGEEVNRYYTDPNDAESIPDAITTYAESFEAEWLPAGWTATPSSIADWTVNSDRSSDGSQSLKSGAISHSQTSGVMFDGLFSNGTLRFDYYLSSESCCDYLIVYIDGIPQQYRVQAQWTSIELPLTSGEHDIHFVYRKDSSVSSNSDAVWIDNITF
jgi:hypothetical protein